MVYEIDQSGKIEDTSKDTIVACGNGYTILLSARNKRLLQKYFREINRPRNYVYFTFSILLFILIKDTKHNNFLIDIEYPGKNELINGIIFSLIREKNNILPIARFGLVGKHSLAHRYASQVAKRKATPSKIIDYGDVVKLTKKLTNA